jgi:aminopeptidase
MASLEATQRRYAELLIRVGVNLQPGQCLVITSEVVHRDFVQMAVAEAYRAGAKYVRVEWDDPLCAKSRLLNSAEENLDYVPEWVVGAFREFARDRWARLSLTGEEFPNVFDDVDPARLRRAAIARSRQLKFYAEAVMSMQLQWCVAALPTPNWARKVFPQHTASQAVAALWDLILSTVRLDQPDPVAAWREHDRRLGKVVDFMARRQVRAVHFLDTAPADDGRPATDLMVGLTDAPVWVAAGSEAATGVRCFPNMPTEEVFSSPHRLRVHGYTHTSKPGFPLEREVSGAYFRFEDGKVVEFHAATGEDVLRQFFEITGVHYLGEVALVDVRSPINKAGVLFYNTLFDENAVCHIAFGKAYTEGMAGADALDADARLAAGLNESDAHCDMMIGTPTMDVTGVCADGSEVVLMAQGEFVSAVVD